MPLARRRVRRTIVDTLVEGKRYGLALKRALLFFEDDNSRSANVTRLLGRTFVQTERFVCAFSHSSRRGNISYSLAAFRDTLDRLRFLVIRTRARESLRLKQDTLPREF